MGKSSNSDALMSERKKIIEQFAKEQLAVAPWAQPHVMKYSVQLAQLWVFAQFTLLPLMVTLVHKLADLWAIVQPHMQGENMNDIVPAICGLILCFFGGMFPLGIAAIEAFRMAGYQGLKRALMDLHSEAMKAVEAHKKDEEVNGDANENVNEKLSRKALIVLRVTNPDKVTAATTHLSTGLLMVLASLKMSFARAITLGATIGDTLHAQYYKHVGRKFKDTVAPEYQKWVDPATDYVIKFISVTIAFMLQTVISAIHSAIRGGALFGTGIIKYAYRTGRYDIKPEDTNLDEAIGYGCAGLGFLWQLSSGFALSFPFSLIFLPISFLESLLVFFITWF